MGIAPNGWFMKIISKPILWPICHIISLMANCAILVLCVPWDTPTSYFQSWPQPLYIAYKAISCLIGPLEILWHSLEPGHPGPSQPFRDLGPLYPPPDLLDNPLKLGVLGAKWFSCAI
ncbi:hypothetical protein O181_085861 [Austropuccinia psidii MF-1]|uniref:Uncharacterized protein n=1 Tax=Austropuccinia psidii MF-1 TaxID=1389203 RepID=A0A9Q3IK49_9BASI|nr:hypothetical protein [Austropuccinia psidii MF-1]